MLSLKQVQSKETQELFVREGVKGGVAQMIPLQISAFKRAWNGRIAGAEGLLRMKRAATPTFQPANQLGGYLGGHFEGDKEYEGEDLDFFE